MVGGGNLPLWKIWESQLGWWHSQQKWENKSHVPNHQPDICLRLKLLYPSSGRRRQSWISWQDMCCTCMSDPREERHGRWSEEKESTTWKEKQHLDTVCWHNTAQKRSFNMSRITSNSHRKWWVPSCFKVGSIPGLVGVCLKYKQLDSKKYFKTGLVRIFRDFKNTSRILQTVCTSRMVFTSAAQARLFAYKHSCHPCCVPYGHQSLSPKHDKAHW